MGAGTSKFLANEYNNGQFSVPGLVKDAMDNGIPVIPYNDKDMGPGDVAIFGDNDHAALGDGAGGYYGNSSSQNQIVHGSDLKDMGGLMPTKIIKTGTGGSNGQFTYQAKDASGNPFLNLQAYIRTSDPNEAFDQQSVMNILSQQGPSYAEAHQHDYLYSPDFETMALAQGPYVGPNVMPVAKNLMANRDAALKAQIDAQNQQLKLQQASQLAQLINNSESVDNRRGYAALGKMFGINLPDGADQFVNSGGLLEAQNKQIESERNYNFQMQQEKDKMDIENRKLALQQQIAEAQQRAAEQRAAAAASGGGERGGYSGGGSGDSSGRGPTAEEKKIINNVNYLYDVAKYGGFQNADDVEALRQYVADNVGNLDADSRDVLNSISIAAEFQYNKSHGNENIANGLYNNIPEYLREDVLPDY